MKKKRFRGQTKEQAPKQNLRSQAEQGVQDKIQDKGDNKDEKRHRRQRKDSSCQRPEEKEPERVKSQVSD